MDQHGSTCYISLNWLAGSNDSKVNPVGSLIAEKLASAVLIYVFKTRFPASLLIKTKISDHKSENVRSSVFLIGSIACSCIFNH